MDHPEIAEYSHNFFPRMLIIHRFTLLGILVVNGIPVEDMGIVAYDAENVLPLRTRAAGVIDSVPASAVRNAGTMPSSARTATISAALAGRWAGVCRCLVHYRLQECEESCDQGLAALPGMRAGLQAAVRTLQYIMQEAGNLLILVTAVVGNKTGHG